MDWIPFEWITANSLLWINLLSSEIGLVGGILLRAWWIENRKLTAKDLKAFVLFQLFLPYLTVQGTFSDWKIVSIAYFGLGLVAPVLAVAAYNIFIAAVPNLLQNLLPQGITKWFASKSASNTGDGNNNITSATSDSGKNT